MVDKYEFDKYADTELSKERQEFWRKLPIEMLKDYLRDHYPKNLKEYTPTPEDREWAKNYAELENLLGIEKFRKRDLSTEDWLKYKEDFRNKFWLEKKKQKLENLPSYPPSSTSGTSIGFNLEEAQNSLAYAELPGMATVSLHGELEVETEVNTTALNPLNSEVAVLNNIISEMPAEAYNLFLYEGPTEIASELTQSTITGMTGYTEEEYTQQLGAYVQAITALTLMEEDFPIVEV